MTKPKPRDPLTAARADLAAANAAIDALGRKRSELLLGAEDLNAVEAIDATIERQQRTARAHADRVKLLEVEAQRAETSRQAKGLSDLVARLDGKLAERDKVASDLQATLSQAVSQFHLLHSLNTELLAAAPIADHEASGAILFPGGLVRLVAGELFRLSAQAIASLYEEGDPTAEIKEQAFALRAAYRTVPDDWRHVPGSVRRLNAM